VVTAGGGGYAQPLELGTLTATATAIEGALGGDAMVDGDDAAMAFAVADDTSPLGPTGGVGVVVPGEDDNSMTARFELVWIKEHDGGVQLPTTLDVSIEGVRAMATKPNGEQICVFFSDYYHIKSWDVATQKFGLKLMEQPPSGGGSVELSFFFLTQEARMIAGAVKAQVRFLPHFPRVSRSFSAHFCLCVTGGSADPGEAERHRRGDRAVGSA